MHSSSGSILEIFLPVLPAPSITSFLIYPTGFDFMLSRPGWAGWVLFIIASVKGEEASTVLTD
ncbi:MAG: hypothetical protein D3910_04515 [Candidatus Electrothrix sp. ATG2]|nr:hypothetical protein [Candidatus Electrothrix sp. ATG2]